MKLKVIAAAAILVPAAVSGAPTGEAEDIATGLVCRNDSSSDETTLHENAPQLVNTPDVPRFAVLGKEDKFYLGVGANIVAKAVYDFGNPVGDADFFLTSWLTKAAPGDGAHMSFSAAQSGIYLNVVALPGSADQLGAYVSFSFLGGHYTPYLEHAYLRYRHFVAGYTYSLFSDIAAVGPLIDFEGPDAATIVRHALIGYEPVFGRNRCWKAGVGLEMPECSVTPARADDGAVVSQRVPDIPFYLQRMWAGGDGWVRASGLVRNLLYRDVASSHNVNRVGWGAKIDGHFPVVAGLSLYGQGVWGRGVASYIQDLTGCGADLVPESPGSTVLRPVEVWGAYATAEYAFSPKLFATATYSHVRTYGAEISGVYRRARYVSANLFYDINTIAQVGVEYVYGQRKNYDGSSIHNNRLEAMIKVGF